MSKASRTDNPAAGAPPPLQHRPGGFGGGGPGRGAPAVKPKDFGQTMRRLWGEVKGERRGLGVIAVFVLLQAAITVLGPLLIGRSIDAIGIGYMQLLYVLIVALTAAYISEGGFTLIQGWLLAGLSQRIVMRLRQSLFAKLQRLPLSYFDTRPHGEVMSRLTNDIDNVSTTISQSTIQLMSGSIAIVGSLIMMLVLSPLLTLAALITVPLVYLLARTITKRTRVMFKDQQAQLGRLNGHIEETISGQEVVKAFNHEERSIHDFETVNGKLYQAAVKAGIWSGFMMPLLSVINNIGFAAIALTGGLLAVNGTISVGIIASFIGYSRQFVRPLNEIAQIYNVLQAGVAGAERAFEVLDEPEETADRPGALPLRKPRGHVVFEEVSFGYREDVPIIQGVSFEAAPGSSTALVGPTGAGKTTMINLLTRFYDVTGGRILLDGTDLRDYERDQVRSSFGIVLQDTYLFSGSIKDNIKYGKPEATDEEVEAAARLANADLFIRRLQDGYETRLTENGGNLSQGQRQLLAIARVILADPAILILDEATSSIDTRTELHIQEALLTVMKDRTTFIIAHRLSTIQGADTIIVLEGGSIAEQGSHEELLTRQGYYYQMVHNQFRNLEPVSGETLPQST
ncbi:ABC transporter ATP-binding protein [Paenibacillus sp. 1P07SE]|uniref:ABC transporter ATP-binding protein n=1 Tax=Paenibacillus sp. 1P07SE TaxID=3132209 RepID=UPI0039A6AD12